MRKRRLFQSTISRIVAVIIALVLPINIITLVLSNMVLENNKVQTSKEIQNTLDISMSTLNDTLRRATRKMIFASYDEPDFLELSHKEHDSNEKGRLLPGVKNELENIKLDYSWIDLMFFQFPLNDLILLTGHPGFSLSICKDVILEETSKKETTGWQWEYKEIDGHAALLGIGSWSNSDFGCLLNLERLLWKMSLDDYSKGRCIFLTDSTKTLYSKAGEKYLQDCGMTLEELEKNNGYGVFYSEMPSYDLCLVEIVDWSSENQRLPAAIILMQILSIVTSLLVIPLLLLYVKRWISSPLNRLTKAMDQIEQGNLDCRIETSLANQGKEFEQINHNFNAMMEQVKNLKIDVYEKELEQKNIKMRYLSQQIQPHFILNAMNILYSYEAEEYPMAQKMILCLSKYFRYVVKANTTFVELYQEMDYIKNYFEIQKARFPELFFSIVEYDESLKTALIPPLLVQNFVENAIKHSLKIGRQVTIYVVTEKFTEDDRTQMRIRIADTGEGISEEILKQIEEFKCTGKPQKDLGVGIQNSIERIKYLYHNEGVIHVGRDKHYSGTNVEIILPVHYAEEGEDYGEDFFDRRRNSSIERTEKKD